MRTPADDGQAGQALLDPALRISRIGYAARDEDSLFPKDAQLKLPQDSYSLELRRKIAFEAAKGSFSSVQESLFELTGQKVSKHQIEILVAKSAVDYDNFYTSRFNEESIAEGMIHPLLVLSCDGKGIVMRKESLRENTRQKAEEKKHKLNKRLSKGEKSNSKRMATVASVYHIARHRRVPEDIVSDLSAVRCTSKTKQRPKPAAKRTWASILKGYEEVIACMIAEGLRRDPRQKKSWVVLVDGDRKQILSINKLLKDRNISAVIIVDIIHVIE